MRDLPERQAEAWRVCQEFHREHGRYPSVPLLGEVMGIRHQSAARLVDKLVIAGLLGRGKPVRLRGRNLSEQPVTDGPAGAEIRRLRGLLDEAFAWMRSFPVMEAGRRIERDRIIGLREAS